MHIFDYTRYKPFVEKNATRASKHIWLNIQWWQQAIIAYFDVATQA